MASSPSTLMVAVVSDLDHQYDEVQQVVNYLRPQLLQGKNVTVQRLIDYIDQSDCELFWLSGHGTFDGFMLSDGLLSYNRFAPLVRAHPTLRYLYFNTCESREAAETIAHDSGCDVIATIAEVEDRLAYMTGANLARNLSRGQEFLTAFQNAKPANNTDFLYFAGRVGLVESRTASAMPNLDPMLENKVNDHEVVIYGDKRRNQVGLLDKVGNLEVQSAQMVRALDSIRWILIVIGIFVAAILAIFLIQAF